MRATDSRPATRRDHVAVAIFGTWAIAGLYVDGWAHAHLKPETFFTPWHAILYSGIVCGVAFFAFARRDAVDRLMLVGVAVFAVGAVGDLIWHTIFGIELSLAALLSPTHLMLMLGAILMLTGPLRSAGDDHAPSLRDFGPTIASLTLATLVVSFFTNYLSAFRYTALTPDQFTEVYAVASVFVSNTILLASSLYLARRWSVPLGTHAILFGAVAAGIQTQGDFRAPLVVVAAAASGFVVDVATRGQTSVERRVLRVAVVAPLALWSTWLIAVALTGGVHWPAELPLGVVVMATLEGWGLAVVLRPA